MSHKRQIFKISALKKLLSDENSCVSLVPSTRILSLPPLFLNDMKSGIIYLLNSILKKYDRTLDGILIGYQNIKMLMDENTGIIQMGAAETEVNVRVEFYIFQPKIGSYLEGVVNKKSNNHIGCLVHTYFNATILKPEDVEFEDWICKDVDVNDKIIFRVKDLDFTGFLPYIEGTIDEKEMLLKKRGGCDQEANGVSSNQDLEKPIPVKDFLKKEKKIKTSLSEQSDEDVVDYSTSKKKRKSSNDIDVHPEKVKKKHKKKDKNKKVSAESQNMTEEKQTESYEGTNSCTNEKEENVNNSNTEYTQENKKDILEQRLLDFEENEDNLFQAVKKKKKKKLKKFKDEEIISTENIKNSPVISNSHGLEQKGEEEDNVFYSTQLDTSKEAKKMNISFCSPIPQETTVKKKKSSKEKWRVEELQKSLMNSSKEKCPDRKNEIDAVKESSEEKKSTKKRKREKGEDSFGSPVSKKAKNESLHDVSSSSSKKQIRHSLEKTSNDSKKENKVNGNLSESTDEKSTVQTLLDKIYKEQMNRVMKQWSSSDRESSKSDSEQKSKIKSSKSSICEKKDLNSSQKVESQIFSKLPSEEQTKPCRSPKKKSSILESEEMPNIKPSKSPVKKNKEKKDFNSSQSVDDPLLAKLLSEAKSAISCKTEEIPDMLSGTKLDSSSGAAKIKSHVSSPVLLKTSSGKKKNKDKSRTVEKIESASFLTENSRDKNDVTKKNKDEKRKKKDSHHEEAEHRFTNGSMYDIDYSPLKVKEDKSLFSDSEASVKSSPAKRKDKLTGHVSASEKESEKIETKHQKQSVLGNLYNEMKKIKSEQKESEKKIKNIINKSEGKKKEIRKETIKEDEKNSLYEKLLENAKSFLNLSEEESLQTSGNLQEKKKKKKKEKKEKEKSNLNKQTSMAYVKSLF